MPRVKAVKWTAICPKCLAPIYETEHGKWADEKRELRELLDDAVGHVKFEHSGWSCDARMINLKVTAARWIVRCGCDLNSFLLDVDDGERIGTSYAKDVLFTAHENTPTKPRMTGEGLAQRYGSHPTGGHGPLTIEHHETWSAKIKKSWWRRSQQVEFRRITTFVLFSEDLSVGSQFIQ
ncbi:MAG: hypothetical protein UY96_C0038G0011 [Parcubacteria group bacterium GW2011_GWB1_56_8]|nr:MAG: hypothetical protein UY96_C0038G0011 [Parcubacteria group bacterium GW2011_GWB1_56_8]